MANTSSISIMLLPVILLFIGCRAVPGEVPGQVSGVTADNAMAVTAHALATDVGVDIMERGGNAVDAAIAVQFALAVVYPSAGNLGGGGFMVIRMADGSIFSLDFREKAPLKATRKMYQDGNGKVTGNLSTLGHLASGVPGSVDGMIRAYERFGTLPWKDLVQPAIDLAEKGYPLTFIEATKLNENREEFITANSILPEFLVREKWNKGDTIRMPDLAATLRRVRDRKRAGFYEGETAELILSEMQRGNGIITQEDLNQYESKWREPVTGGYKNLRIISMGPPSSGGIALIQLLGMIEKFEPDTMAWQGPAYVHLLIEAEKRVYADRASWLGDSDFYPVPVSDLLSSDYLDRRMEDFSFSRATPSDSVSHGNFPVHESEETTHFSIVDAHGNAVAVTTTLNGSYGSKVVVGGAGFLLNNEMDDFSIKPGFPNMFGLIGGDANAIEPGKRMLSSMTPTIVEKNGSLFMVIGSPGGSTIITSVLQCILNVTDFNMDMQQAVAAPRFHHQWKPEKVIVEPGRIPQDIKARLSDMGHHFEEVKSIGSVNAIRVPEGTGMEGGADPRGENTASGF